MKKFLGLSMAAGAALLLTACESKPPVENVTTEADGNLTDLNESDSLGANDSLAADNLTADNATITENAADNATTE